MSQSGQHNDPLFAGLDSDTSKIFSLEVKSHTVNDALNAMEKAITELRLCQLQFGYESSADVKAMVRHS
ncbi:hypothetical protein [Yersinia enterocolitica]|uniref:hypothetical protein n=1 Tax=Yersinia enterocolitica TaxID=630 RepID=UPI0029A0652F|nr:hypothetical protein [Yersinia enterocolitica]HEI6853419.1 hypothetical protein [Yersinia enterocolitica]